MPMKFTADNNQFQHYSLPMSNADPTTASSNDYLKNLLIGYCHVILVSCLNHKEFGNHSYCKICKYASAKLYFLTYKFALNSKVLFLSGHPLKL